MTLPQASKWKEIYFVVILESKEKEFTGVIKKNHVEFSQVLDIGLGISRDVSQVLETPAVKLHFVWNFLG